MAHDVFISYSSKDKTVADAVVSALENENMRCWYAPRDIQPGADWGESITEAIHDCQVFLLIFSNNSNQSKRVLDEVYFAISEEKTIVPFRIENLVPTGAMSLHLSSKHWLDAYHPSWSSHLNHLSKSLKLNLGREVTLADEMEESPQLPLAVEVTPKKKLPWLWISLAIVLTLILTTVGIIWVTNRPNQVATTPTSSVSDIEPTEVAPTEAEVEEPTEMASTHEEADDWHLLEFRIPDPQLWEVSGESRYTAVEQSEFNAYAWSTENFEGDLTLSFDLESPESQSEGCVIIYGGGHEYTYGSLIFCVESKFYQLEKHTRFHEGENFLIFSQSDIDFKDQVYSVTIEIIGDVASMFVNGQKVLSTFFDLDEISRFGRIGLHRVWAGTEITFSNIKIKIPPEEEQVTLAPDDEEFGCELDSGGQQIFYVLNSPYNLHTIEVDGKISSSEEWSGATCVDLRMHYGVNYTNPDFQRIRWWVQNNDQEISFLVRAPKELELVGVYADYFWPEYTGTWPHSDGAYVETDGEIFDNAQWDDLQWYQDVELDPPGTVDVEADSSEDVKYFWIEIKRPLNSGDVYDWVFNPGQTYGDNPYDAVLFGVILEEGMFTRNIQLGVGGP